MSSEANKAVSRRFLEEAFNQGNLAVIDEILTPDHANSGPGAIPDLPGGPEGSKIFISAYRAAFPDIHFTVDEQIAEGDSVMTRWTATGTHMGELAGMTPTGKTATVTGIVRDHFVNGKIAETWGVFDQFGMLQQLGVLPAPPA